MGPSNPHTWHTPTGQFPTLPNRPVTLYTLQCATSPHHPQCHTHNHTTQVHNNRHRSLRLQTTKTKTKTQNTVFGNKIWGFSNCFRETVFPKLKKNTFQRYSLTQFLALLCTCEEAHFIFSFACFFIFDQTLYFAKFLDFFLGSVAI